MDAAYVGKRIANLDGGVLTAIITAIAGGITALIAAFYQWRTNKKRTDIDAQASVIASFVSLVTVVQGERDRLLSRIVDLEANNHKQDDLISRQDRHITRLVRIMVKHNIEVPEEDAE